MAVQTANPGGVGNQTRDGLKQKLNFTNSSMQMPETKDAIYGAFGDILQQDDENTGVDPIVYNVYQQRSQTYDNPALQQYTYGTGVNPVFEWVKTIQTGRRSYNPQDNFDTDMMEEYRKLHSAGQAPDGALSPDELMKNMAIQTGGQIAGQAGGRIAQGLVDPYLQSQGKGFLERGYEGLKTTFSGDLPLESVSANTLSKANIDVLDTQGLTFDQELANLETADLVGRGDEFKLLESKGRRVNLNAGTKLDPKYAYKPEPNANPALQGSDGAEIGAIDGKVGQGDVITGGTNAVATTTPGFTESIDWTTPTGKSNWASAGGAGLTAGVTTFVMTGDVEKSAKVGLGTTLGKAAGTAIGATFGPVGATVGGFLGATIGGALGGRVICNELCKQGLIDRKMLINDYKFTRDYLSPQYVNGYHMWALFMVKQMRKGRFVSFWQHIVVHRGNEIAYIYGETNKPDYLGKLYRKIFEPVCWILGTFCKQTDWSVLYQKKEI